MEKILVVVDMQRDFVSGSLGTDEAKAIVPNAADKIRAHSGSVIVTFDTHTEDYLDTAEGKKLPVKHCIKGTDGWELDESIKAALKGKKYTAVEKPSFGSVKLPVIIDDLCGGENFEIELIGLCTDICVISNALLLKAYYPDKNITVDSACCAGVTPQLHNAALSVLGSCQINVI